MDQDCPVAGEAADDDGKASVKLVSANEQGSIYILLVETLDNLLAGSVVSYLS